MTIRAGTAQACRCFGDLDAARLGAAQLIRNLVLLAAAALATYAVVDLGCVASTSGTTILTAFAIFSASAIVYLLGTEVERMVAAMKSQEVRT